MRWPSCQIQWVSMAVMSPGAAAATWVNIASDTSKWLLECDPHVRPQASQSCATRTEPAIVQKCGSASGMSTAPARIAWPISRQSVRDHVGRGGQAGGALELGHHLAAGEPALGADRVLGVGEHVGEFAAGLDRVGEQPAAVGVEGDSRVGEAVG